MPTKSQTTTELSIPAIRVEQGKNRFLYTFAVDGKIVPKFATVSRIKRTASGEVAGYQRPEILSHIAEIRAYLESEEPMVPNAVVVAFDARVTFRPDERASGFAIPGTLSIPIDSELADFEKPGWVVDGQQRLAAIRDARIDRFPICAVSFIADDLRDQAEQFILVNSTKPLPKGLIYELLPSTAAQLPSLLQRRRLPALLLERLNTDADSPLHGMIRTPTIPTGIIKDNSILRMIENSLTDGALYRFRASPADEDDLESMLRVLNSFWAAVASVFKTAWGISPRRSRLMHGAGIVSMGFVMDAIADRHCETGIPDATAFEADIQPLADVCRWTDGYWDFGPGAQRKWNELQNTHKDIQLLANYLLVQYRARVWDRE
ncbi:MAG: DGQHR domain-containing protein DpdB [Myxococcota bacterium]